MKIAIYTILAISMLGPSTGEAQILNGGFEQWTGGEPAFWLSNNVNEPEITITPITRTSIANGGSYALKGEVVAFEVKGQTLTVAPFLQSGNQTNPFFPFSGKPKRVRGYYHYTSVGGDVFIANVFLSKGTNLLATGSVVRNTSTGPGYHELVFDIFYLDTLTVPTSMQVIFQIGPASIGEETHDGSEFVIDDFPKMSLIKPREDPVASSVENPVYIAGEIDTIKWDGGGALSVDLEYSTNGGTTFLPITSGYPADSNRYFWDVPASLLTREARIRVLESGNTSNVLKSELFSVKPWQLTRLDANDKFDLFEPSIDGWRFSNSRGNVWPQAWWQRFDYSGVDPITGEDYPWWSPFRTAPDSVFPDWPLFVDVFGQENCYVYGNSYRSEATTHWNGMWAGIASPWGGSCAGFAVTSLLGFYHKDAFLLKFPNVGTFSDLFTLGINDDRRYAINNIYSHQYGEEVRSHRRAGLSKTPRELLSELKQMFRKENGGARSLNYYSNSGSGAHAVTPYKLERIGDLSSFRVRVYDSRAPGSTNGTIRIDSSINEWTDHTGLNWGFGSSGCFLERESVTFLSLPTLPGSSTPFLPAAQTGSSRMILYTTSRADVVVTSSVGQIGYQDSTAFTTIADAAPIIPITGDFHPPIGYDLPADEYALQINEFTDASSHAFFLADTVIYNYRRFDALQGQEDRLAFHNGGIGIRNPDSTSKITILETMILDDTTSEKVFVASNVRVSGGDSLRFQKHNRTELLLQNHGEGMSYNLQARIASATGAAVFVHDGISMQQNSTHRIIPVWDNLVSQPVKILIDSGNTGTFDDSLFVTNQVTNVERGQDAGIPDAYALFQNYPNPFNPSTTIRFQMPRSGFVTLSVYDVLGRHIRTLVNENMQAGNHDTKFDALGLASGDYLYRLQAGDFVQTRKLILLR